VKISVNQWRRKSNSWQRQAALSAKAINKHSNSGGVAYGAVVSLSKQAASNVARDNDSMAASAYIKSIVKKRKTCGDNSA